MGEEEEIYSKGRGCEMMMEVGLIRVGGWYKLDGAKTYPGSAKTNSRETIVVARKMDYPVSDELCQRVNEDGERVYVRSFK